jgi:hypothetical protein
VFSRENNNCKRFVCVTCTLKKDRIQFLYSFLLHHHMYKMNSFAKFQRCCLSIRRGYRRSWLAKIWSQSADPFANTLLNTHRCIFGTLECKTISLLHLSSVYFSSSPLLPCLYINNLFFLFPVLLVSEQSTNPRSSILASKLLPPLRSSREKICQLKLMPAFVLLNKASLNTHIFLIQWHHLCH